MKCPMKSCKFNDDNGECHNKGRCTDGGYNCKFENCECYTENSDIKHKGYKLTLIGDSSAELLINPKKFDLLTCYKLSEAFALKGDRFSPAMIFEEVTSEE